MNVIILASNNPGKIKEFNEILADFHMKIIPQENLAVTGVAETGLTFIENAILKARNAAKHTGLPAIADDSGITVDALDGGAPGVFSARYAGVNANSASNCAKLLGELAATPREERSACFHCVVVLLRHEHDPSPIICQGKWRGEILYEACGNNGFGYDPIFYVPTHQCSAAQLPSTIKNKISHRAQALQQLIEFLALNHLPRM